MATAKQNQEQSKLMGLIIGFLALLPLLIVSAVHYSRLKSKYPENEYSQRVFDIGNLIRPCGTSMGAIFIFYWLYAMFASGKSIASMVIGWFILALAIFTFLKIAQSVATTYFGVVVDRKNDRVLLPKDMANYSISDYFNLKFVTELGTMEEVPLSQVRRITRQAGKKLYIHGKFGSRGMGFSKKQKRDECISAIEDASNSRSPIEFENA
ncbi:MULTISPECIES: hypothetical protein [Pseudomonas]|uniref:hypothetical protein n=1 Tax=Pseudomonas TaxID=286 RepID=UPI0011304103|nr:hypothetical protein [Pseudomonas sp. NIBRBAC000502773]QDG56526.1 hypothetical protein NIBR502773_08325 [Pseudomonas sp. NIBRBAC000502773]